LLILLLLCFPKDVDYDVDYGVAFVAAFASATIATASAIDDATPTTDVAVDAACFFVRMFFVDWDGDAADDNDECASFDFDPFVVATNDDFS